MSVLPSDCVKVVCQYLSISDLMEARQICRHWRLTLLEDPHFFASLLKSQFLPLDEGGLLDIRSDVAFHLLVALSAGSVANYRKNILQKVLYASSSDRWEESPLNMIKGSAGKCYSSRRPLPLAQIMCQCTLGDPCYWSSAPSPDENSSEFIIYQAETFSLVDSLLVRPYQATWHPGSPIYGPKEVIVEFLEPRSWEIGYPALPSRKWAMNEFRSNPQHDHAERAYYRSPALPLSHSRGPHLLRLPKPQLLIGGRIRLIFRGKYQRQTLGGDDFYMCLNPCKVFGVPISTSRYAVDSYEDNGVQKTKITIQGIDTSREPIAERPDNLPSISPFLL